MRSIASKPFYIFLLPIFFFLHVYAENFAPGLVGTVIIEISRFIIIAAVLTSLLFLYFRSWSKAALPVFFLFLVNFLFGGFYDWLRAEIGWGALPARYSFIIPFILLLLTVLVIYLRKTKKNFGKLTFFLNLLFMIFIVIDLAGILPLAFKKNAPNQSYLPGTFKKCDTCAKPDVYVIIVDEYAGQQEVKEIFNLDNTAFENNLKQRGFHFVNNTKSNYNATVYSMAALFNMEYIDLSAKDLVTQRDMLLCRSIINNNNAGSFFKKQGYSIYNHSFFAFQGKKKAVNKYYFPPKRMILTSETFVNRFLKDVGYNFFSKKKIEAVKKNDWNSDEIVDSITKRTAALKSSQPKFVYTHFNRPHYPYYVDRNGQPFTHSDSLKGFARVQKEYTEYLLYTNKKLLQLIDHIQSNSTKPPVILLASDHGFRQFGKKTDHSYYFMNLCAVYLPGGNYRHFYDGMSTVNTFRVILNSQFGQQFPLLKDSSIFLIEKP